VKTLTKILCPWLTVWYILAVTGIDVHTDSEHGQVYVAPSFLSLDCEHLHPHDHCHDLDCNCEENHMHCVHPGCEEDEECCHDDFLYVLAQGKASQNDLLITIVPEMTLPWIFRPADFLDNTHSPAKEDFLLNIPPESKNILTIFCVSRS